MRTRRATRLSWPSRTRESHAKYATGTPPPSLGCSRRRGIADLTPILSLALDAPVAFDRLGRLHGYIVAPRDRLGCLEGRSGVSNRAYRLSPLVEKRDRWRERALARRALDLS